MAELLLTVSLSLAVGGKPEVVCRRRGRMEVGSVRRRQMAAHHQTGPSLQRQHQHVYSSFTFVLLAQLKGKRVIGHVSLHYSAELRREKTKN